MRKFVNQVGSLTDPYFVQVVLVTDITTAAPDHVERCYNVFNFGRESNSIPGASLADVRTKFWADLDTPLLAALSQDVTVVKTQSRWLDDPTSALEDTTLGSAGQEEDECYASDTAVYMQLMTGYRGRSFFGSKHFSGLAESQALSGYLNGAGITQWDAVRDVLQAWGTAGMTDADGITWKLCVISQSLSTLDASPAIFTGAEVNQVLLNERVGTMGTRRGPRTTV